VNCCPWRLILAVTGSVFSAADKIRAFEKRIQFMLPERKKILVVLCRRFIISLSAIIMGAAGEVGLFGKNVSFLYRNLKALTLSSFGKEC
jgi:hypothetical protein